jgi:hypothetical protein
MPCANDHLTLYPVSDLARHARRWETLAPGETGPSATLGTRVLPCRTTCFGPRTKLAGLLGTIWRITCQSKSIRITTGRCFTREQALWERHIEPQFQPTVLHSLRLSPTSGSSHSAIGSEKRIRDSRQT